MRYARWRGEFQPPPLYIRTTCQLHIAARLGRDDDDTRFSRFRHDGDKRRSAPYIALHRSLMLDFLDISQLAAATLDIAEERGFSYHFATKLINDLFHATPWSFHYLSLSARQFIFISYMGYDIHESCPRSSTMMTYRQYDDTRPAPPFCTPILIR